MPVKHLAKLNRSTRSAALAALAAIVSFAMYNWIVAPHAAYLSAAQGYESAMSNIVMKNKIISTRVKVRRKNLQKLREQSALLQSTLFTPEKAGEFFSDLQAITEETGCIVHSVNLIGNKPNPKYRQSEDTSGVVAKSAVLSVVGAYKDIASLMKRLQARTQKVWIDSVKVQTLEYGSDRPKCDITITICEIQDKEDTL
ncbi:MAG: hypothetical protein HQ580_09985 [Planctomycetes bacterium]|nr:hypothetical protein [Planctomycetota bacterium]